MKTGPIALTRAKDGWWIEGNDRGKLHSMTFFTAAPCPGICASTCSFDADLALRLEPDGTTQQAGLRDVNLSNKDCLMKKLVRENI